MAQHANPILRHVRPGTELLATKIGSRNSLWPKLGPIPNREDTTSANAAAVAVAATAAAAHAKALMLRCAPRESAHIDVCCTHRSSNIARLGITPESMEANTASTPRRRLGICETVASRNLPTVISMRSPGDVCWYNAGRQTLAPALLASSSARSTCRCSEARRHVSWSRNCSIERCVSQRGGGRSTLPSPKGTTSFRMIKQDMNRDRPTPVGTAQVAFRKFVFPVVGSRRPSTT
mmetsp:Transcript_9058/g.14369  ORF Transcript_9058/g.14369 Transcript_9058/m.14369 type:complete len:235 (+) Transcript_9058:308-1012(+)